MLLFVFTCHYLCNAATGESCWQKESSLLIRLAVVDFQPNSVSVLKTPPTLSVSQNRRRLVGCKPPENHLLCLMWFSRWACQWVSFHAASHSQFRAKSWCKNATVQVSPRLLFPLPHRKRTSATWCSSPTFSWCSQPVLGWVDSYIRFELHCLQLTTNKEQQVHFQAETRSSQVAAKFPVFALLLLREDCRWQAPR